ncbi:protein FLOURY ENDOSPERM 6, chloroplastic-like isoform X2 [Solanum dulcamara]|uniref:protein FLOURY ENDOSPERM 6, chloroplastic-like isoform X2 n=1 Tax=Solanum dulcamara TaxID=45834 RepID=UPI002485C533|nr:protein FLOURY ENDOSPERM 6, chloroplastic-like isoform X2 [Solanum dulcamara]
MVSLIFTPTHLSFPPIPRKRLHSRRKDSIFNLVLEKDMGSFRVFKLSKKRAGDSAYCWCRKGLGSEGDMELEEEILAFMELSENPNAFPTMKELEKAGRVDLVEAIKNRGGWFLFGWDAEDDDTNTVNVNEVETVEMHFDIEEFHRRVESCQESDLLHENEAHFPALSSGRSMTDQGKNGSLSKGSPMKDIRSDEEFNHSISPAMWRKWSKQRAGLQEIDFEAGEAALGKSWIEGTSEASGDDVVNITESRTEALRRSKNDNHNGISTRLQHLELELSLTLCSLKSNSEELRSKEVFGSSPSDSDAWEFQENESIKSRERLRLIRAKLAVLEGKMTLAMNDAQKMLGEKQKRIDRASKALQLLRTAWIVWPNSASEVLLVGSFDGWTTQRKMERSSTGVFSVNLKLYPGRYEIKFVVDGIWKIDPLRPIVHNNGHENNLLIVT